jgi:hypothetical protein
MKFMRCKAGYTLLVHRRSKDILEELKVDKLRKILTGYNRNI